MTLLHAFFGLFSWWWWLLAVIVVVGITYLGFWAPVLALIAKVPREIWIGLAAVVAIAVGFNAWLQQHDEKVEKAKDDYYLAREKVANDAAEKRATELHRQLELATAAAQIAAQNAKKDSEAREATLTARIKKLEEDRPHDITVEANRRCALTRGVIVHFNRGADAANGSTEAAGGDAAASAGSGDVDTPAEVSLDSYAAAVEQTQSALGTCRNQVTDWQTREATVIKPWIDKAIAALSSCIPQGASP